MTPSAPATRPGGLLGKIGLHRPELRAWAMYDWAVSAVQTTIMVAVFPIYFIRVAGADVESTTATQYLAVANSIVLAITAVISPVLGAIADYMAIRKRLLAVFMIVGALATGAMFSVQSGDLMLASVLFVLALGGASASFVFYESLLPHLASPEEVDRVSTAGYAFGYIGGGVLLALNLAWISAPQLFGLPSGPGLSPSEATLPARLSFLSVAAWWLIFSIPLFRRVPEPPRRVESDETAGANPVTTAFRRLGETVTTIRGYRQAFLMLLAFLLYNDGIQTIIKMATAYGTEIGIDQNALILAILIVQFVGIPFAFLFGMLAARIGAKRSIFLGLLAYVGISILGYFMTSATHFFMLAALVGMVQGGTQALSRSLFASMVPPHKSGEFFGFFSVFEKFAGIFGPLLYAGAIMMTGSSRNAILSVIVFFIAGAALLSLVDVDEGRRVAREAEEATREPELAT
ncbi:MAG: MFS transporter [Gemmatimonadetes bacterium]|nr:MFS transporter [Gemmatimonadota bacterium]